MNVYDNANELAKAMRESHEYKKLKQLLFWRRIRMLRKWLTSI